jgi:hypothetical protein
MDSYLSSRVLHRAAKKFRLWGKSRPSLGGAAVNADPAYSFTGLCRAT